MKTHKYIQCPFCGAVKFLETDTEKPQWVKFNCFESSAIETIIHSDLLFLIFGVIEIEDEVCDDCNSLYSNPN